MAFGYNPIGKSIATVTSSQTGAVNPNLNLSGPAIPEFERDFFQMGDIYKQYNARHADLTPATPTSSPTPG